MSRRSILFVSATRRVGRSSSWNPSIRASSLQGRQNKHSGQRGRAYRWFGGRMGGWLGGRRVVREAICRLIGIRAS